MTVAPPELPADWLAPGSPPLVLDLGCHRGTFLIAMARLAPQHNFLGVERQNERVVRAGEKIARLGLANARVVRADAFEVVQALPARSVAELHALFSDPWPKRRHAGRRLVNPAFLLASARALRAGGLLRILTDDPAYARDIERHLAAMCPAFAPCSEPAFPPTRFEARFEAAAIFRFCRERTPDPACQSKPSRAIGALSEWHPNTPRIGS